MTAAILNKYNQNTVQLSSEFVKEPVLPPDAYKSYANMHGKFITKFHLDTDKLLAIKSKPMEEVNADISMFLTEDMKGRFKDFNLMYRRGYLLEGPPGTGKSALVNLISDNFIKTHGGIVFRDFQPGDIGTFIRHIRSVELNVNPDQPQRPVMLIREEFDDALRMDEFGYTNLLDGEYSIPNTIFLATTNYIERIPSRIRNRPSRFAMIKHIGFPDRDARYSFLENIVPEKYRSVINLDEVAEKTDNVSIDHLKDVVISICCFGQSYDDAVLKIREMQANDDDDDI